MWWANGCATATGGSGGVAAVPLPAGAGDLPQVVQASALDWNLPARAPMSATKWLPSCLKAEPTSPACGAAPGCAWGTAGRPKFMAFTAGTDQARRNNCPTNELGTGGWQCGCMLADSDWLQAWERARICEPQPARPQHAQRKASCPGTHSIMPWHPLTHQAS